MMMMVMIMLMVTMMMKMMMMVEEEDNGEEEDKHEEEKHMYVVCLFVCACAVCTFRPPSPLTTRAQKRGVNSAHFCLEIKGISAELCLW